jgi:hypothetical protein
MLALSPDEQTTIITLLVNLVQSGAIPSHEFTGAYDHNRSIEKKTPRFAVLDVEHGGPVEAMPAAVQKAIADDFFFAVWAALIARLPGLAVRGDFKAVTALLGERADGVMQSVLRAAALRSVDTLPSLLSVARATALIRLNNRPVAGTGFLVSPNLILTAAHVVDSLLDDLKEREGSASEVSVLFHNRLQSPGEWPIPAHFAPTSWLVDISPPNGAGGSITLTPAAEAAEKLDFALIQLAEPVGNITGIVDIANPPAPEVNGRLTVIGYQGGTQCVFDDHLVQQHEAAAGRVRHLANTVAGMSGGPCIDSAGRAVAVHEGSISTAVPQYNRAVHLGAVRDWMKRKGVDPLTVHAGPLWSIDDRQARHDWIKAGESLLAPAERASWADQVAIFNPDDQRVNASSDIFHPVFGRESFQDWILQSSLEGSTRRIALISGHPGSGKSFSAHILRHSLKGSRHQIVEVRPAGFLSIADALILILQQAGETIAAPPPADVRPSAGILRRDLLPGAFDRLDGLVRARAANSGILWIVLDVADDSMLSGDSGSDWKQFMIEVEKRPWARLLILGLSNSRRVEFKTAAAHPDQVASEGLQPITADEFKKTMVAQAEALRLKDLLRWGQECVSVWDDTADLLAPNQGRSVVAVRIALETRELMKTEAAANAG